MLRPLPAMCSEDAANGMMEGALAIRGQIPPVLLPAVRLFGGWGWSDPVPRCLLLALPPVGPRRAGGAAGSAQARHT